MQHLHVIIDSNAQFPITKTELDSGIVTQPYVTIAHCIRSALCISHNLRRWVQISICFNAFGPLTLTFNPNTLRFMGTDERSILYITLRGLEAGLRNKRKRKSPLGVTVQFISALELISKEMSPNTLLLLPGHHAGWFETLETAEKHVMFCPTYQNPTLEPYTKWKHKEYKVFHKCDLSILEVIYRLEGQSLAMEKD